MLRSELKRASPCQRGVNGRVTVLMLGLLMLMSAVLLVSLKTTSLSFVAFATGAAGDSQLIFADGFEVQTAIISQPVTFAFVDDVYVYQAAAESDPSLTLTWTLLQAPADMIVDAQTGQVEWLPATPGDFAVTLRVDDSREGYDEQSYTITVSTNQPPVIISTPVTTAVEGQLYEYDVDAEDPELGDLTYSLAVAPIGMDINASSGLIEWTPSTVGDFPVTIAVRDTGMATTTQSFTIVVEPAPDQAPIFISEPILTGAVDEPYRYQAEAVDSEGGSVTYNLISAPTGVTLISTTGLISWTPAFPGSVPMVLQAVDANGLTSEQSFAVDISAVDGVNPPEWQSEDSMIAPLGRTTRFQLAAADQDKDTLRYFVEPLPLPANMKMNSLTGLLEFTPDVDQVGTHTFDVAASDGRFRIYQSFVITVPAPSGVTTLEGRVQEGLSDPLPGVRIVIDGHERVTDADGYFKVEGLSITGDVPMLVDGTTVPSAETYATIPKQVHLIAGADNILQDPIILLPLDTASADVINPAAVSSITSAPVMKGGESFAPVTLTVPTGQAVWEETGELFSGSMHITNIPDNTLSPQPLPPELDFSVYVAMQPFGIVYNEPVPISFPNVEALLPGTRMEIFGLDHESGAFVKFGDAEVSADGQTVDSIGGVVVANSWHGIVLTESEGEGEDDDNDDQCDQECGSMVGLSKGNLNITHDMPVYTSLNQQRGISLTYNSTSAEAKPIIKFKQTNPSRSAQGTATTSARLNVGGVTFTAEQFWIASAQEARGAQQFDATGCPSEVYDWQIELASSIPERFGKRTTTIGGKLALINLADSPFGSGWHVQGLEQIIVGPTGDAMIIDGSAEAVIFRNDGAGFVAPIGDFSELVQVQNGYERHLKNGTIISYRSDGRMIEVQDRNGNSTSYSYDVEGRLNTIIDPVGLKTSFNYFAGKLKSITDPAGRQTTFQHDSFGNLVKITEPDASVKTYSYLQGSNGRITSRTDHRGNVTSYIYDSFGRLQRANRPDDSVATSRASALVGLIESSSGSGTSTTPAAAVRESEVLSSITDGNNHQTQFKNDARGRPIEIIDDLGRITRHERNTDSLATRTQRADGSVVTRTFDEFGNTLSSTEAFNNATTTWTYDAFSQVTSTTDARGNITTIERDANGNATRVTNALGHVTNMEYDQRGLITRSEDPNGLVTDFDYNGQGLPVAITRTAPDGEVRITQNSYDAAGQLIQRIGPDGVISTMVYDLRGRLVSVTDNLGQSQQNLYDAANNLLRVEVLAADGTVVNTVEHVYDSRNRRIETILPHESALATTGIELDGEGNTTGIIDPTSNITLFQYDAVDRLVSEFNAEGGITAYQYDALDNLISVVAPNGAETTFDVDSLSRITAEHSPDRGTLQYSYDRNNNRIQFTDARGIVASYSYDALNRLTAITYSDPTENVTMTYDNCNNGIGRLCQVTDESGQYDYSYDVFGNQLALDFSPVNTTETLTTAYVYDSGDNVVQITYPSGRVVSYSRDELSRIIAVDAVTNGITQSIVNNIEYRADGLITKMTHGNAMITVMDYDLQGRMLHKTLLAQDASTVMDERFYQYDADNNITARSGTPGDHSYRYDAVDRLIEQDIAGAENIQYRYDLNGNRLSRTIDAGSDIIEDQLSYQPDSNRLTEVISTELPNRATQSQQSWIYNQANRMAAYLQDGTTITEYIVNSQGQRSHKLAPATANQTIYHYSQAGYQILTETTTDASNTSGKDYIWLNGEPIAQIDSSNGADTISHLHTDHLLTPRLATDAAGLIIWRWEGEAFGDVLPQELAGISINLRFPGQYYDKESGLFYNMFRDYNPATGRYVESDPIGIILTEHEYAYSSLSPLRYFDDLGLQRTTGRGDRAFGVNNRRKRFIDNAGEFVDLTLCDILPGSCITIKCIKWKCKTHNNPSCMIGGDENIIGEGGGPIFSSSGYNPDNDPNCRCIKRASF